MNTTSPATLKDPLRACEPGLAATDHMIFLPKIEAEAQGTFEVMGGAPQSVGLKLNVVTPDDAAAPTFNLMVLNT